MWRKFLIVCLFSTLSWPWAESAVAGTDTAEAGHEPRRIALVIGNESYADSPLANPANDARAMSRTLRALGFEVLAYENASRQRMQEAVLAFRQRLAAGGVGLFYFAGHGLRSTEQTSGLPHSDAIITSGINLRK